MVSHVNPVFALIHSPLVGPLTWSEGAEELRRRGFVAVTPTLEDTEDGGIPYWRQHADSVARALKTLPNDRALILVGHSGAGPILPAIRQFLPNPVAAYVFVDSGIPRNNATRLAHGRSEDTRHWVEQLRAELIAGGRFPNWSDQDLAQEIPDPSLRAQMIAELRPRGLAYWEEPIPVFAGFPDAPCAYLQFTRSYAEPAGYARLRGWAFRKMDAGHFHMLVDPIAVTDVILDLAGELIEKR
jgi:pimeloyl-ACP methyl ester carboxylesterase